jgi:hypothetical protein
MAKNAMLRYIGIIASIFLCSFFFGVHTSYGQAVPVSGTLDSNNIGSIYLSGNNGGASGTDAYQVNATVSSGTVILSGWGWSPSIGWVSFNTVDVATCPGGGAISFPVSGGAATGYARAIAGGSATSGGWNGCLSASGTNGGINAATGASANATYSVTYSNGVLSGFGWGSPGSSCSPFSGCQVFGGA